MKFFYKLWVVSAIFLGIFNIPPSFSQASMSSPVNPSSQVGSVDGSVLGGLYNLNLFTGVANIRIPIYEHPGEGGADFGISLTYNTKGVKAEQYSSEVGLNWNVYAGGSIVRVLKDLPDELYAPNLIGNPEDWPGGYADFNEMRGRWAASFESPSEAARTDVYRDKESDDFIVSAGSLQFTFNIGKGGDFFTHPNRRVTIELLDNGTPITSVSSFPSNPTSLQFRIRDEHGDTYYFNSAEYNLMTINSVYRTDLDRHLVANYALTLRWVLDKIVFRNSSVIKYNYTNFSQAIYAPTSTAVETSGDGVSISVGRTEHNRVAYLSSVQYPNNVEIEFEYIYGRCDMEGRRLSSINVSAGPNNCIKYKFYQSYFVAKFPGNTTYSMAIGSPCNTYSYIDSELGDLADRVLLYRLKLDSISMENCSGTYSEPFYSFNYSNTPLGIRGDGSDYFGYYNGRTATLGTNYIPTGFSPRVGIPYHSTVGAIYGLDKSSDPFYMDAGVLTEIRNANGGTLKFEYSGGVASLTTSPLESHLTLPTDSDFIGAGAIDGLRIIRITATDAHYPNNSRIHEYTYSNGQRFLIGGYMSYPLAFESLTSNNIISKSWSSSFVTAHHQVQGSNHGYSNVTEAIYLGFSALKYVEYTFSNLLDETSLLPRYQRVGLNSKHYYQFPYSNKQYLRDWEIGLPLSIKEYDGNYRPVLEKTYDYQFTIDSTTSATKQVENEKVMYCDFAGANYIELDWGALEQDVREMRSFSDTYRPFTGRAELVAVTSKNYVSDNSYTEEVVNYTYDSRGNLSGTFTWDSDGRGLHSKKIYNYHVYLPNTGSDLYRMSEDGLEIQVGNEQWLLQSSGNLLLDASISTFGYQNGLLYPKGLYVLSVEDPVSACSYSGECGSPPYAVNMHPKVKAAFAGNTVEFFTKISEATIVDSKGNPLESQSMGKDIFKATIWDTVHGFKLAEAANAHYADIAYNGFEVNPIPQPSVIVNQGNVSYFHAQVTTSQAFSGRSSCLLMNTFQFQSINGLQDLTAGREYILTFWALGASPQLLIGTTPIALPNPVKEQGGWRHYIVKFVPTSNSKIKFQTPTANTVYIDEIRLHPAVSVMQSWTHEPMFGVSSSTDASGRVVRFEYDEFGREIVTRDEDGYIRKKIEQSVRGYN